MKRFCVLPLLCLSACMVGPSYHKPQLALPSAYTGAPGWVAAQPADGAPKGNWWRDFHDPLLDALEPQVALHNATLAADYDAYAQAVAVLHENQGALFPVLGLTGSETRDSNAVNFSDSGTFEGNASWVPDIWGKIRRQIEQSRANAQVSAADLANARLSIQATLAADYVGLRTADANIALLQQTVAAYQRSLTIAENQAAAGTAAPADVITARTQLAGAQSQLVAQGAGRAQFLHALAVLIGQMPENFALPPGAQIPDVPLAPLSLPATLLQRRPDIAAAERNMAAQNAAIGVALGAYYPNLTLSALGGFAANPITGLFSASNSLWSLGASAAETLFDGGARSEAVAAAGYGYQQSVNTYRATVLTAFQDVENDLSNLQIYGAQALIQARAVSYARSAAQIALNEYEAGTVSYTTVVTAQVTLLSDQQTQLTIQQERLLASIALFQDLGGGFNQSALALAP